MQSGNPRVGKKTRRGAKSRSILPICTAAGCAADHHPKLHSQNRSVQCREFSKLETGDEVQIVLHIKFCALLFHFNKIILH